MTEWEAITDMESEWPGLKKKRCLIIQPGNFLETCRDLPSLTLFSAGQKTALICGPLGPVNTDYNPRVRCFLTRSKPSYLVVELDAKATFNMMDQQLSADVRMCLDAIQKTLTIRAPSHSMPKAFVFQGSGPHFCPGGNHHPVLQIGSTLAITNPYSGGVPFQKFRELALPGVCGSHGSQIGGGVAITLNMTTRICGATSSLAFGNLSRGACPIMNLSQNLAKQMGWTAAMDIYLTDSTVSAYAALSGGLVRSVCKGVLGVKNEANMIARAMAASPAHHVFSSIDPGVDTFHDIREGLGFMKAAMSGELNATTKVKAPSAAATDSSDEDGPEGQTCAQCGSWGLPGMLWDGQFFCEVCSSGGGGGQEGGEYYEDYGGTWE